MDSRIMKWPEMKEHIADLKLLAKEYPNVADEINDRINVMWDDIAEGENVHACIEQCQDDVQLLTRSQKHEEEE